jgi:hypothetical protein
MMAPNLIAIDLSFIPCVRKCHVLLASTFRQWTSDWLSLWGVGDILSFQRLRPWATLLVRGRQASHLVVMNLLPFGDGD